MRADIQRKPIGFQEVASLTYRCVSFCVTNLNRAEETLAHSLVFKTTEFLEQPSSTSLLQLTFANCCPALLKVTLKRYALREKSKSVAPISKKLLSHCVE